MREHVEVTLSDNKYVLAGYDGVTVQIHLQKKEKQQSVFMICGTDPNVGATSTAIHIAAGLAKTAQSVLLLDADMRKAPQKKMIGKECENTLAKYLMGQSTLEAIQYETNIPNLTFVPAGFSLVPVQLLCTKKLESFIKDLRGQYDFIIINVSAAGASADSETLLGLVDQIVMVAAPGRSYKKQVIALQRLYQQYQVPLLGVLVNRVDRYAYREYYKHSDYYMGERKKVGIWRRFVEKIRPTQAIAVGAPMQLANTDNKEETEIEKKNEKDRELKKKK